MVIVAQPLHGEMTQNHLSLGIILGHDASVGALLDDCLFRREVALLKARERVDVVVRVHSLPDNNTQPVIVFIGEPLLAIEELIDSPVRQVCCKGFQAGPQDPQRVLEPEVFANGEGEILLHPLTTYLDLVSRKVH